MSLPFLFVASADLARSMRAELAFERGFEEHTLKELKDEVRECIEGQARRSLARLCQCAGVTHRVSVDA